MISSKELDDLIEIGSLDDWFYCSQGRMLLAFKELKQRRESALRPANKYLANSPTKQLLHILSEVWEIGKAWVTWKRAKHPETSVSKWHLAEELVDLQMSCETMLTILGLNKQERNDIRRMVIAKNAARGYYTSLRDLTWR